MKRVMTVFLALLGLLCVAVGVGAQTAELTMWTFPEPDRLPLDLALAPDGGIYMTFFIGESIGMLNPDANTLVEWALEGSPSHMVVTDDGIFYTLPVMGAVGFLDPDRSYTLIWYVPTAGSSPDRLVQADYGPGIVNFYVAERNAGKIAVFEPASIGFRSLAGVARVPVTCTPFNIDLVPDSLTETPIAVAAAEPFTPQIEASTPQMVEPFQEWTPTLLGEDFYIDGLVLGPDGGIWFTQGLDSYLGVLIPWDNMIARYPLPEGVMPATVATAPDESIWFVDASSPARIGRLFPDTGDVELWVVPSGLQPFAFIFDTAERVWFSDREADAIYRFDPNTGIFVWWTLPFATHPLSIIEGKPGTIWFASEGLNAVGRLVMGED